ncbi:MAG: flagellar motor protein, partial [Gammaproteobacteria bacterium]|nr:flagellar motor protein [Gammaproteobacteria bacterium]
MDPLTATGVALALIALIGGSVLKGAGIASLANPAAFVIVVVGTLASSLIQTPKATFMRAWKIFPWIFKPPMQDNEELISKMVNWSEIARKEGLLG